MNEKFKDMKLRKFQVDSKYYENILSHIQGGYFEFKMIV